MLLKKCPANATVHFSILIHVYRLFLDFQAETRDAKNLLRMGDIDELPGEIGRPKCSWHASHLPD